MARVYLLSILLFVGLVQAGPLAIEKDVDFIENMRGSTTFLPARLQNSDLQSIGYTDYAKINLSGFGYTDESWLGDSFSNVPVRTFFGGYSNEDSAKIYRSFNKTTVCDIFYKEGNGGILTKIDADDQVTQISVVSFGSRVGCAIGRPSGYIRPGDFHSSFDEVTDYNFEWGGLDSKPQPERDPEYAKVCQSTKSFFLHK